MSLIVVEMFNCIRLFHCFVITLQTDMIWSWGLWTTVGCPNLQLRHPTLQKPSARLRGQCYWIVASHQFGWMKAGLTRATPPHTNTSFFFLSSGPGMLPCPPPPLFPSLPLFSRSPLWVYGWHCDAGQGSEAVQHRGSTKQLFLKFSALAHGLQSKQLGHFPSLFLHGKQKVADTYSGTPPTSFLTLSHNLNLCLYFCDALFLSGPKAPPSF